MKTFFNVLYRRILYKIPLKLLLILLAVFGVLFACFSSAENVSSLTTYISSYNGSLSSHSSRPVIQLDSSSFGTYCLKLNNITDTLYFGISSNSSFSFNAEFYYGLYSDWDGKYVCLYSPLNYIHLYNPLDTTVSINYDLFKLNALLNTELPVLSSLECQTTYNLIPISSVDQNYCMTNNLCPSQECPDIPVWTGEYSQLYINNILHLGAPNIIMNIPDEIDWDYAYTAGGQNMNIDVVGYNVDYEKIDSIVQFQNYKPTGEDFQKIIGLLAPYTKIIVFFVFLFIVWAWIKKPFKSKKL